MIAASWFSEMARSLFQLCFGLLCNHRNGPMGRKGTRQHNGFPKKERRRKSSENIKPGFWSQCGVGRDNFMPNCHRQFWPGMIKKSVAEKIIFVSDTKLNVDR